MGTENNDSISGKMNRVMRNLSAECRHSLLHCHSAWTVQNCSFMRENLLLLGSHRLFTQYDPGFYIGVQWGLMVATGESRPGLSFPPGTFEIHIFLENTSSSFFGCLCVTQHKNLELADSIADPPECVNSLLKHQWHKKMTKQNISLISGVAAYTPYAALGGF